MRIVDLKIRTKLFGAFGILILLGFILAAYYGTTLWLFKKNINSFSNEFLPQLELSNRLSTEVHMVAFNMEGYYLTGKPEYFTLAKTELELLKGILSQGEELLEKSKNLTQLEQNLSEAKILMPQYEQVIMMAFKTVQEINILQDKINHSQVVTTNILIQTKKTKKNKLTPIERPSLNSQTDYAELAKKNAILQDLRKTNSEISEKLKYNSESLRNSSTAYTAHLAAGFEKSIK